MKRGFRVLASIILPLLLLCFVPLLSGCSSSAEGKPFQVTYYYMPGCSECDQAKAEVAALEKDFPGKVRVQSLDATSPEAKEMVERLGFKEQGLVIQSHRGAVLWKRSDHRLKMDEVRQELQNQIAYQEAT
jgi:hypothetical protein